MRPVALLALLAITAAPLTGCVRDYPSCSDGESVFTGTLDGAEFDRTLTNNGGGMSQMSDPATLGVDFLDGGSLELQWDDFVLNDQMTGVTGTLQMGADAEVLTVSAGSTMIIRDEHKEVYLVLDDGELTGCVGF